MLKNILWKKKIFKNVFSSGSDQFPKENDVFWIDNDVFRNANNVFPNENVFPNGNDVFIEKNNKSFYEYNKFLNFRTNDLPFKSPIDSTNTTLIDKVYELYFWKTSLNDLGRG